MGPKKKKKRLKNDLGLKYLKLFKRNFPLKHKLASKSSMYMEITVTTANLAVYEGLDEDSTRMMSVPGCEGRVTELFSGARHSREMSHRASVHWSTPPPQPSGAAWHAHTASCQSGSNKWGEEGRTSSGERRRPQPALAEYAGRHPDRTGRAVKFSGTL